MKVLLNLILLLALTLLVDICLHRLAHSPDAGQLRTPLSVGLLILGGWLAGLLCERISLPAITGYLLFGILIGPSLPQVIADLLRWVGQDELLAHIQTWLGGSLAGAVPASQVRASAAGAPPLQFASDLAIALIALLAGGEIHLPWLRGRLRALALVLVIHVLILFLLVAAAILAARPLIPFLERADWPTAAVIAVLCAVVMIAKSPAVTVAMISDYRAAGPMSQMTLVITVFKDLLLIVIFATVMAVSRGVLDRRDDISGAFLIAIAVQLIGSIGLGAGIGLLMAAYVKYTASHLTLFVIGACLLIALIGEQDLQLFGQHLHLEPLLMALSAGLLMRNAWPRGSAPLFQTLETASLPVYCLFFALAGARIDLHVFAGVWQLSLALVAVRLLATWSGVKLGVAAAGLREDWTRLLWLGMVSQAGVSLVLVTIISKSFQHTDWAAPLANALIGAIIINQLIGPIGFRWALFRSREAGRAARGRSFGGDARPAFQLGGSV